MQEQLVVFRIAQDKFGVNIASVEGIVKVQQITVMPLSADFVEGVINLRGSILPIISMRKRFGLQAEAYGKDTRIVMVDAGSAKFGVVVDEVVGVMGVSERDSEAPSPIATTSESGFVRGIAKTEEGLVILLEIERLLTEEQLARLDGLAPAA